MNRNKILLADFGFPPEMTSQLTELLSQAADRRFDLVKLPDAQSLNQPELLAKIIDAEEPRLLVLATRDGQIPGLLQALCDNAKRCPVVWISDRPLHSELYNALTLGAEFFLYPFNTSEVLPRLRRLLDARQPEVPLSPDQSGDKEIIGVDPQLVSLVEGLPVIARCDETVLITGESGTGKEVFARKIHSLSKRLQRPFCAFDCGTIPVELTENELFGHERGAYTGAMSVHKGIVNACQGGTLFLDEIDCLPLNAQVKLLRLLQEKEYRPLGSSRFQSADIRVIAATNVSISTAVKECRFRQDLFFRLNVFVLNLPPLRDRLADIPLLTKHFVKKYCERFGKKINGISPESVLKLKLYNWPGNVRELEHVIERAVMFCGTESLVASDIDFMLEQKEEPRSLTEAKRQVIKRFEKEYLVTLLLNHKGNVTRAAVAAQKNRRTFLRLLKKYQINPAEFRRAVVEEQS